jgi:hypothetical protein
MYTRTKSADAVIGQPVTHPVPGTAEESIQSGDESSRSQSQRRTDPPPSSSSRLPDLLRPSEAAEYLGMATGTLARWRVSGKGPRYCKIGARVRYPLTSLAEFLRRRERASTSDSTQSVGRRGE